MIHRRGHGLHQHDEHRAQPVADLEAGTGASRHDDTQRKTQRQSNAQGDQSQLQRDGDLLGNDLGNGDALAVDVGFSQVPVEHLLVKAHQLGGQGSGHAKSLKFDLNLGGAHFIVILEIPFHGHQPQQGKEDRDNDKHGDEGAQNALGYISGHMMSSWGFSPFIRFPNKMVNHFIYPLMWMAAIGGRKCMDFLFCGCAAGRLENGMLKRFLTVLTKLASEPIPLLLSP